MTRPTDPLFDQRITDWLEDDPVLAPRELLDNVFIHLQPLPRRRPFGAPWRIVTMRTSMRWPFVAAAVAVVVLGGTLYLQQPRQPAVSSPGKTQGPSSSVVPGPSSSVLPSPSAAIVQPAPASWTGTGNMITARAFHTATLLRDGKVLVAGGLLGDHAIASAELYDPSTRTWIATGSMIAARSGHTATLLPDGTILVAGGGSREATASAELYDPSAGTWIATGSMHFQRSGHTATLLPDGKVLVAGGTVTSSAELYDPTTRTWTATGTMVTSRSQHTATLLPSGMVLVAGGSDGNHKKLASAELYDPRTATWTATESMNWARAGHTATLLPDGAVLVAGGAQEWSELYPCETLGSSAVCSGTWAAIGFNGKVDTSTLLPDGTVLAASDGVVADLYDPSSGAAGSWIATATGSTETGTGATATLLRDGAVLEAGGEVAGGDLDSAELYHPGNPAVALPAAGDVAPGTYFLANPYLTPPLNCDHGCSAYGQISFALPVGWATSGGLVYKHLDQADEVAFSAWTVDQVYADPCHWLESALSPLDLANHSHDARTGAIIVAPEAGGLANQALRGARPRALTQVTLGGYGALRIQLSVPADLDVSTCDQGQFRSWTVWEVVDGANSHNAPGQIDTVYLVDTDRRTLVIDASHMPGASAADLAELDAILASMVIW